MVTVPDARRRGHARAIVHALARWARRAAAARDPAGRRARTTPRARSTRAPASCAHHEYRYRICRDGTRSGSRRCRRGPRSSASAACTRSSTRSATRSARTGSVHVVGTNGKSTATRTIAALLRADGLDVGAYTSPHVSGWHERLDTDADVLRARGRARASRPPRPSARRSSRRSRRRRSRTSPSASVDAAVVEAGLGGRLDATNVLDAPVVLLTNVGLEHTDVLGDTREEIAREKLAVARPGATVVLPDDEWRELRARHVDVRRRRRARGGRGVRRPTRSRRDGRRVAARDGSSAAAPDEVRDGAHTPEAVDWLLARLEPRRLDDRRLDPPRQGRRRDAVERLAAPAGRSSPRAAATPRALDERELARPRRAVLRARRGRGRPGWRARAGARARARSSSPARSICLPTCTTRARTRPCIRPGGSASPSSSSRSRCSAGLVGVSFAAGYIIGRLIL